VTLVRAPATGTATIADDRPQSAPDAKVATESKPTAKPSAASAEPKAVSRGVVAAAATTKAASSAAARPAASTAASTAARTPAARTPAARTPAARTPAARAPQRTTKPQTRVRANALVTPEHYAYVRNDLIRTGVLAATMFLIIVIAYFYLHAHGLA
jgi:hypothetical protein